MKISGNLFSECPDHSSYHTFSDSGVAFCTAMELVAIKRIWRRTCVFFQYDTAVPLLIIGLSVHIPLRRASYYLTGCIQLVLGILLIHSILLRAKDAPCPAVDSTLMPEITDCHIICLRHSLDRI